MLFLSVVMSSIEELEIKNIDHLGIVAGIVDSVGLVETIAECRIKINYATNEKNRRIRSASTNALRGTSSICPKASL